MQNLEVFQSVWAMERRRPDGKEWSLEEQVEMLVDAGYAGMDLYSFKPEISKPANKLLQNAGLACTCCAFPKSIDGFQSDIDMALVQLWYLARHLPRKGGRSAKPPTPRLLICYCYFNTAYLHENLRAGALMVWV